MKQIDAALNFLVFRNSIVLKEGEIQNGYSLARVSSLRCL
jgi:hypothetical protein